jgi:DNA (cytosine-5)-methyltransferase 1
MQGGNTEVKVAIQKIDIPQTVKVRKYPVDTERLCKCLREHKVLSNCSNMVIAQLLNVPQTKVEHWFRQDEYFAIPDAEIWFDLKQILGITTVEFDKAILTFEEKEGVYEKSERHYFSDGLSPTLTSMSGSEKILVSQDLPLALDEQNKYIRTNGTVGTIMTDGSSPKHNNRVIQPDYRIRKLTPKECWRLMGFDDADFDKAKKVCSNSQLYKQAGNSIVVNVLEGILDALLQKQSRSEWLNELLGDV